MREFSLVELIAAHGGVRLRDIRVPNYTADSLHPTRTKRTEKLYLTEDGAFIVPRHLVKALATSGAIALEPPRQ
jgi:hypothetical protein